MNDLQTQLEQLSQRIDAIESWQAGKIKQQITFPLDIQSLKVLNQYYMHLTDTAIISGGASGNTFVNYIGNQGNYDFSVNQDIYILYSVNPTTDIFTITGKIGFSNGTQVVVSTSDTTPSPLVAGTTYYVVNSTGIGQSFKLSSTLGGSPINITTKGTGEQYIFYFQ